MRDHNKPCAWCKELIAEKRPGSGKGRPASFCSVECKEAERNARVRANRLEQLAGRKCEQCSDPIPRERSARALTCSLECSIERENAKKASAVRARLEGQVCGREGCDETLAGRKSTKAQFCSTRCSVLAQKAKPEQQRKIKAQNRKHRYKLTGDEFQALLEAQGHRCASCRASDWGGKSGAPHVDHDHFCCPGKTSCGRCIRGLLCNNCNQGLGSFRDNIELLQAATEYLARTHMWLLVFNLLACAAS